MVHNFFAFSVNSVLFAILNFLKCANPSLMYFITWRVGG